MPSTRDKDVLFWQMGECCSYMYSWGKYMYFNTEVLVNLLWCDCACLNYRYQSYILLVLLDLKLPTQYNHSNIDYIHEKLMISHVQSLFHQKITTSYSIYMTWVLIVMKQRSCGQLHVDTTAACTGMVVENKVAEIHHKCMFLLQRWQWHPEIKG